MSYSTSVEQILRASAAALQQIANDLTLTHITFTHRTTYNVGTFEHLDEVFAAFYQQNVAEMQEKVVQQLITYCNLLREQLYVVKQLVEAKNIVRSINTMQQLLATKTQEGTQS